MSKYYQGVFTPKNRKKCLNMDKVVYRSGWELALMIYLDRTEEILEWSSEAFIIPYIGMDNKPHRYFPDFFIKILNKKTSKPEKFLLEVKPKREVKPPKNYKDKQKLLREQITFGTNQLKWKAADNFCKTKGWAFKVITEKDLGITKNTLSPIDLQKVLF